MGEFSPVQLDALEDALEDLELAGIPIELGEDGAVSDRLTEYRNLLQLSREALPMVEVPTGLLDDVFVEAREEAARPAMSPADAAAEAEVGQPWWRRLSLWIPALAVGASAALVLVLVRGTMSDAEPQVDTVASADKAEAKAEPKADEAPASAKGEALLYDEQLQAVAEPVSEGDDDLRLGGLERRGRLRGSAVADDVSSAEEFEPEDVLEEEAESPGAAPPTDPSAGPAKATDPTDKVIYEDGKDRRSGGKKSTSATKQNEGAVIPPSAKPKSEPKAKAKKPSPSSGAGKSVPAPGGSSERADALAGAERDRLGGRCGSARKVYRALLDDDDASVRSKALAGLGLCAYADGDEKGAQTYFSRAKKADARIGSFIERERAKLEPAQQSL